MQDPAAHLEKQTENCLHPSPCGEIHLVQCWHYLLNHVPAGSQRQPQSAAGAQDNALRSYQIIHSLARSHYHSAVPAH
jgi:hypothetical protein